MARPTEKPIGKPGILNPKIYADSPWVKTVDPMPKKGKPAVAKKAKQRKGEHDLILNQPESDKKFRTRVAADMKRDNPPGEKRYPTSPTETEVFPHTLGNTHGRAKGLVGPGIHPHLLAEELVFNPGRMKDMAVEASRRALKATQIEPGDTTSTRMMKSAINPVDSLWGRHHRGAKEEAVALQEERDTARKDTER